MAFFIEKIILHNRAPFPHAEIEFPKKTITVFNGVNGGGKTTIISHIVDAFHEMARKYYLNEFEGFQSKFYRVSSSIFNLNMDQPSFVYVRFNLDDEHIDYVDIRNEITREEYDENIDVENKISFDSLQRELKNNSCIKYFSKNLNKEKAEKIFENNLVTYFPHYRFEYPGYLNDPYRDSIKFNMESKFSGVLPNPIEVITDLPELANWIMDVVLDWQLYKQTQDVLSAEGQKIDIDITPENLRIITSLNSIVDLALNKKQQEGKLRLGIGKRYNPGQRLSIMRDISSKSSKTYYPSIFNISAGEASMLSLFGEILHQADNIGKYSDAYGIVIIDEVDKHLHVKLQRDVLPTLFQLFPNIQFIISSHSPFVSMGLSEKVGDRSKIINLSEGSATEIQFENNPLFEEIYEIMLAENTKYKELYESLKNSKKKCKLLVEDTYSQIYKIAWLKLKGIDFEANNIDTIFEEKAAFEIIKGNDCSGIAGLLNAKSSEIFKEMNIIGLFDYDKEGSEKFYNLKEGFEQKNILGTLTTGFYKVKKTMPNTKIQALILPIPERLKHLISRSFNSEGTIWDGDGKFSNYVEIETLLQVEYLESNPNYESNNICGFNYYKAKDNKKKNLWKELVDLPRDAFIDFAPLFKAIHDLFEIDAFN